MIGTAALGAMAVRHTFMHAKRSIHSTNRLAGLTGIHPQRLARDRVVIKNVEMEETTKGGILLTSASKEKPQMAEVLAVGPGGMVDGKEVVMNVKPGQKVIYSKYAGTEVKVDGQELIIVRQSDILATVE